jgi:hypothetical protein
LFLLLLLCRIFWKQVLWCLWHCSFYSGLLWLFSLLCFHVKFRIIFSSSVKNITDVLMVFTLNL